ncbi:Cadherin-like and PC-esterase domain-containing protein 1 [Exaiptasia diaphana]|nr:Cadherin-like and PC-esterase domain-containing protein 1 [Exaiptasia diaphana]
MTLDKLYPTNDSLRYRTLLVELRSSSVGMVTSHNRGTPELHSALLQLENYGSQGTNHDTTKQHDSKRKEHWQTDDEDDSGDQNAVEDNQAHSDLNDCDDDRNTAPVLTDIFIKPEATINPTFDNEIMEYEVVFPFSVMMINLWGTTSTCWSAAAVNSKSKPSKEPVSYYLGVGWNEFIIFLLHLSNRPPAVVATYKINIYRQTRNERRKQFDSRSPHEVCTLKQKN